MLACRKACAACSNRYCCSHTEKDRLAAALDYEVNVKAETAIAELNDKVDRLATDVAAIRGEP
jgi:uncharacterized membrane protein